MLMPHRLLCTRAVPSALRPLKLRSQVEKSKGLFVDWKRVRTQGGKGGDGCIAFLSEYLVAKAGPGGGDGGCGGHILFQATTNVGSLAHIPSILKGHEGGKGMHRNCCGKNGVHLTVPVPLGTAFKPSESGETVAELWEEGEVFVAARGGAGGKGNLYFMSATNQCPEVAEYGAEGESILWELEMRMAAHFGLVGFPNAGKSTLLKAVTRANPRVAPYPFCTVRPQVGAITYEDGVRVQLADVPGLIKDAHRNRGMGVDFLRHLERCVGLIYLLDLDPLADLGPVEQLHVLRDEVGKFKMEMINRPGIVVANKVDLGDVADGIEETREEAQKMGLTHFSISAKCGKNLASLLQHLRILFDTHMKKPGT